VADNLLQDKGKMMSLGLSEGQVYDLRNASSHEQRIDLFRVFYQNRKEGKDYASNYVRRAAEAIVGRLDTVPQTREEILNYSKAVDETFRKRGAIEKHLIEFAHDNPGADVVKELDRIMNDEGALQINNGGTGPAAAPETYGPPIMTNPNPAVPDLSAGGRQTPENPSAR
jgi:hypothetical protein